MQNMSTKMAVRISRFIFTGYLVLPASMVLSQVAYRFGVVLAQNSGDSCDQSLVMPVIKQAISDAAALTPNVNLLMITQHYVPPVATGTTFPMCDDVKVFSSTTSAANLATGQNVVDDSGNLLVPQPSKLQGMMILGPACSYDYQAVAMLTGSDSTPTMLLTGQAEQLYSTNDIPLAVRASYSIYAMWHILTKGMAVNYNWINIAGMYDNTDTIQSRYWETLKLNINGGDVNGYINRTQIGMAGGNATAVEGSCDFPAVPRDGSARPLPDDDALKNCFTLVKQSARIIALLMNPAYIRHALIYAQKNGMTSGEYAYLAIDMLHDSIINANPPIWQDANDSANDEIAREAFKSLFVIGLPNYENDSNYLNLQAQVQKTIPTFQLTFFIAAFYDVLKLFAMALSRLASKGSAAVAGCQALSATASSVNSTNCKAIQSAMVDISQSGVGYRGASGLVKLDPYGDRYVLTELFAMDPSGAFYTNVARYDPEGHNYTELKNIPWVGGSPPANEPACGYDDVCPEEFPEVAVAVGVTIPVLCGLAALFYFYWKQESARRKSDHEWIATVRQMQFPKHKKDEFGENTPENMVDESHQAQDTAAEAGHSMGRSMGASFGGSFGGSMGNSMNMTQSMRKKMALMGEHFGSWNKSAVVIRWVNRRRVVLTPKIIMEVRIIRKLAHENIAKFIGGCLDENHVGMMYEMCTKGPLQLMFEGEARAKMDWTIRMSWIKDIVSGMIYLHSSPVGTHSRLTSHCCYIDSRFTLKITDYGIPTIFTQTLSEFWTSKRSPSHANSLLWTAPEVLRAAAEGLVGPTVYTKESDVYSFGIILQEMALRSKPYSMYTTMKPSEIVDEVRKGASTSGVQFRPRFNDDAENVPVKIIELAQRCWAEEASQRPLFDKIRVAVRNVAKDMNMNDQTNIMDIFMAQMEESGSHLQHVVEEKDNELLQQQIKSDEAFLYVFPRDVAEKVMNEEPVAPIKVNNATIMMTDMLGFETMCAESRPAQITQLLDDYYDLMEKLFAQFQCFKVEHNSDTVMAASGIFGESSRHGAREIARLGLYTIIEIRQFVIHHRPTEQLKLRVAITSGPVVLSVLNLKAPRYGVSGQTNIIAQRMLQTAEPLRVHISASSKKLLDGYKTFRFKPSPASPVIVDEELEIDTCFLVDEDGNEELREKRLQLHDGLEILDEEL